MLNYCVYLSVSLLLSESRFPFWALQEIGAGSGTEPQDRKEMKASGLKSTSYQCTAGQMTTHLK